ncbi:gamma-butyrobetaine dioxygenase [Podospora aff. communis PSN243]|uniref:Gamma-butyrobetaine dioxygenase n=1 Tax=Podospora aff. communis PSN243 TaxID=3040156 RepID=A0AAV9G0M7_9PEZI|nr:gamma-butyrobetaine dioxygenase [Podospora aff. communis PSN243]
MSASRIPVAGLLGARLTPSTSPTVRLRVLSQSTRRPALLLRPILGVSRHPAAARGLIRRYLSSQTESQPNRKSISHGKRVPRHPYAVRVTNAGVFLRTEAKERIISPLWLRDSCACPQCVDPDSGQKNFSTTDLPTRLPISRAELSDDGALVIEWENDIMAGGVSTHTSRFSAKQVATWHAGEKAGSKLRLPPTFWNRAKYESMIDKCRVSYADWLNDDDAFDAAFEKLAETGLIFVRDVPQSEAEVERIANRIGMLQHTFYGSTWDVRSKPRAENVAYTSKFLGLHQDLMYHDPVPKLQLLHCLENSCDGGESLFSDGIRAAYDLKLNQPKHYRALSELEVRFHYKKGEHDYSAPRNTIHEINGMVFRTNWAPPFQAPFKMQCVPHAAPPGFRYNLDDWREAAVHFQLGIEAPENVLEVKLQPGECVIFDNTRVLHGRRQFATTKGQRWLKGTYVSLQVYQAAEKRLKEKKYSSHAGQDFWLQAVRDVNQVKELSEGAR